MIKNVEVIKLKKHVDERGYFMEIARNNHIPQFGQWSISYMHDNVIKAWHYHHYQIDYWFVPVGNIKAVLHYNGITLEYLMGDAYDPILLVIPPDVYHGLKVLQAPALLCYVTSEIYNPDDELRLPYDDKAIGYDWDKRIIT